MLARARLISKHAVRDAMKRVIVVALIALLVLGACAVLDYKNDDLCRAGCQQKSYTGGGCKAVGAAGTVIGSCTDTQGPCKEEGACKCYCA
jgi:hypothetical protein